MRDLVRDLSMALRERVLPRLGSHAARAHQAGANAVGGDACAEFERVGGGVVLNNSPYDLAAAVLVLEEAGAVVRRDGHAVVRAATARIGGRVPDVDSRSGQPGSARAHNRGARRGDDAALRIGWRAVPGTDPRDVSLAVPAQANYLVLARLALSAVCRLTPLSAEEIADLKLAVSEAANDYMTENPDAPELDHPRRSVRFVFRLMDDQLVMELHGAPGKAQGEERELGRAIIDVLMDECSFQEGRTRLVKRLTAAGSTN